jgi:hypothetical protein
LQLLVAPGVIADVVFGWHDRNHWSLHIGGVRLDVNTNLVGRIDPARAGVAVVQYLGPQHRRASNGRERRLVPELRF